MPIAEIKCLAITDLENHCCLNNTADGTIIRQIILYIIYKFNNYYQSSYNIKNIDKSKIFLLNLNLLTQRRELLVRNT